MITVTVKSNSERKVFQMDVNDTIMSAFERAQMDIEDAMLAKDGSTLRANEAGKTFAEMNVRDGGTVRLAAYVKQSNAVSIKLVGNIAFIKSALSLEDVMLIRERVPHACSITNAFGDSLYRVGLDDEEGELNESYALYGAQECDGKATIILKTAAGISVEEAKESIKEDYGLQLTYLGQIDAKMLAVLEQAKAANDELDAMFE